MTRSVRLSVAVSVTLPVLVALICWAALGGAAAWTAVPAVLVSLAVLAAATYVHLGRAARTGRRS